MEETNGEWRAERRSLKKGMMLLEGGQCNSAEVALQVCEVALW